MEYQSDTDTASTITPSKPKKLRSQRQDLSELARTHWPFSRMDPKLLERAHRQATKPQPQPFEEAPF